MTPPENSSAKQQPRENRRFSRSTRARIAVALAATCLLSACGGAPRLGGDPQLQVVQASQFPPPEQSDMLMNSRDYYVGPFDQLEIDVFGVDELSNRQVQVDAAGRIGFPLIGVVEVAGKTPAEIAALLAHKLAVNYVRDPQVIVNLKQTLSQVVTVEGQVGKPGLYPVVGRMTLLQAIATAGDLTEFSKVNDVVIFRTVNHQKMAALYNIKAIQNGGYPDPEVYANDIVTVGDNTARRYFKDFLMTFPVAAGPLYLLLK